MSRHVKTLLSDLQQLLRLHERLLELARLRQQAMIARQVEAIEQLMSDELAVAQAVQEAENRRRITMLRVGAELGRRPAEMAGVKLEQLAEWLPEDDGRALLDVQRRLKETVKSIRQINRAMMMLAQRCLPWFEELLNVLLGEVGLSSGYTARGQVAALSSCGSRSVVDIQI